MYLKALEIQGFKSFPDKTVLNFNEDITAIVGPNGNGKSNIADAVRWVMGEQSVKSLRGGKMEDVIFSGTQLRKPMGYAEVSLLLDNTGHVLPIEESEVMVTRRYYRSGESEYYINRRSVRLRDVNELFMDTGLGRDGYSIIGQGRIDEILSAKSTDRREIFEEAAGISRYRYRKEEAERKLAHAKENLVRINDKIDELELQVEPLRAQSEKAEKYLVLREELKGLEISVWLDQLEKLRANTIKYAADYENAARARDEAKRASDALYEAAEACFARMQEKDLQAEELRVAVAALESDAAGTENEISVLKTHMQNNLDNAERIEQEMRAEAGRAGAIREQIEDRRARLSGIEEERGALCAAIADKGAQAEQVNANAGTLAAEMEALREKEANETASAAETKALLSALAAASQELLDRDEAVRRELSEGEERLTAARSDAAAAKKELDEAEEERDAVRNTIEGYRLRTEQREKKAKNAQDEHVRLRMEENALASRIHMLTEMEKLYEGYSKAVRVVMGEAERGGLKGILGPVAGLIHVPDNYALAIETALGAAMQNIVVETEEHGKAAIECLKRKDGGRCTFLPIDAVRGSDFRDKAVSQERGFVGMADALITFEERYAEIFSSLLGRTVIVEDLDRAVAIARKFGHRFKIVTLDGQVLNAGGSMTGGSSSKSAGILSRANELERLQTQIGTLREQLRAAAKTLEDAERELTAANYELETAQAQQRAAEDAILKADGKYQHFTSVVQEAEKHQDDLKNELETIRERAAQTDRDIAASRERILSLEGAAEATRAEAQGKTQGQDQLRSRMEEIRGELAELQMKLAALDAERASCERSLTELLDLDRGLAGDRESREQMRMDFLHRNEDIGAEILEKERALLTFREESAAKTAAIRRLNEEKLTLEGERNRNSREQRAKEEELQNLQGEAARLEQRKSAAAAEEGLILEKLWETYELSHEAARAQCVELESVAKAQRRIGELKRSINALGNINLDAIEDFKRVNERYTYLTGQRDDVENSKSELETIIGEITGEMKTIFSEQFKVISEAFSQTFTELFGGGKATLELEDPDNILDCGIEIKVQPPGKSLKTITLLSGGEKAFVAIAIYCAILKVRPTPFVVMDEIEAALDDTNVIKFARYLRGMAEKTQFIVITHRRGSMEEADVLYGVTMQEQGVSRMLTINLSDVEKELNIK